MSQKRKYTIISYFFLGCLMKTTYCYCHSGDNCGDDFDDIPFLLPLSFFLFVFHPLSPSVSTLIRSLSPYPSLFISPPSLRSSVFLNPFPYGSGVTSSEALGMGIPVVLYPDGISVLQIALSQVSTMSSNLLQEGLIS